MFDTFESLIQSDCLHVAVRWWHIVKLDPRKYMEQPNGNLEMQNSLKEETSSKQKRKDGFQKFANSVKSPVKFVAKAGSNVNMRIFVFISTYLFDTYSP